MIGLVESGKSRQSNDFLWDRTRDLQLVAKCLKKDAAACPLTLRGPVILTRHIIDIYLIQRTMLPVAQHDRKFSKQRSEVLPRSLPDGTEKHEYRQSTVVGVLPEAQTSTSRERAVNGTD
jgi:hypothetical protein